MVIMGCDFQDLDGSLEKGRPGVALKIIEDHPSASATKYDFETDNADWSAAELLEFSTELYHVLALFAKGKAHRVVDTAGESQ
eukprot:2179832-Karenia_brevis.AAC.1